MKIQDITDEHLNDASMIYENKNNKISPVNDSISDTKFLHQKREQKQLRNLIFWSFLKDISYGGLKNVADISSNVFRRVVWLLIVISSIVGVTYMVSLNVQHLLTWPTSTKVEIIYKDQLKFPAITICNYNFARNVMVVANDPQFYTMIENMFPTLFWGERYYNFTGHNFEEMNFDMAEFVKRNGHTKEGMIFKCKWKGETCGHENFTSVVTDFGLCYTFNGIEQQEPLYSNSAGSSFGLNLALLIEDYFYMYGPEESTGIRVFIGDQNEIPLLQDFGFAISPGQETVVRLKVKQIQNLEAPYGSCGTKPLKYYKNKEYTYSRCVMECQMDHVIDKCGCKAYFMPDSNGTRNCYPDETNSCYYPAKDEFAKEGTTSCDCPIPCNMVKYIPSLSYALFPNSLIVNYIKETYDVDEFFTRKNYAKVSIFFEELNIESIKQQPAYEPFNLFNDIGGTLGLLGGASIITLLEVLDFIAVRLFNAMCL